MIFRFTSFHVTSYCHHSQLSIHSSLMHLRIKQSVPKHSERKQFELFDGIPKHIQPRQLILYHFCIIQRSWNVHVAQVIFLNIFMSLSLLMIGSMNITSVAPCSTTYCSTHVLLQKRLIRKIRETCIQQFLIMMVIMILNIVLLLFLHHELTLNFVLHFSLMVVTWIE